ncbi:MAG TPA: hypothetical protein VFS36_03185 [Chitinophagaceae bacterium]|nr:hypothetical protein [Chitinophagaceae bacterium]
MKFRLSFIFSVISSFCVFAQQTPLNVFEDFSNINTQKWLSQKTGNQKYYPDNGVYIIDLTGEKGWAVSPHFNDIEWNNLSIELSVNALSGNSRDIGAGMLFGDINNNNNYRFVITTDGRYGFGIYQSGGLKWIKPFTPTPAILKGNNIFNVLKAEIKNGFIKLYINNNQVDNIRLDTPISGDQISLYAGNGQKTAFDNLSVRGFTQKKIENNNETTQVQNAQKLPAAIKVIADNSGYQKISLHDLPVKRMASGKVKTPLVIIADEQYLARMKNLVTLMNNIIDNQDDKPYFVWFVIIGKSSPEENLKDWKKNNKSLSYKNGQLLLDADQSTYNYFGISFRDLTSKANAVYFMLDENNNIIHCDKTSKLTEEKLIQMANWAQSGDISASRKLYFDKDWLPTIQSKASYYREITTLPLGNAHTTASLVFNPIGNYQVTDFYISGKPQMKAACISLYPLVFDGEVSYYDQKGNILEVDTYNANKIRGIKTYWDNGKVKFKADADGKSGMMNETKFGSWSSYYPNGSKQGQANYVGGKLNGKANVWDEKGNKLADVNFNSGKIDYFQPSILNLKVWTDSVDIEEAKFSDGLPQMELKNKYTGGTIVTSYDNNNRIYTVKGVDTQNPSENFTYTFYGTNIYGTGDLQLRSINENYKNASGIVKYQLSIQFDTKNLTPTAVTVKNLSDGLVLIEGTMGTNGIAYTYRRWMDNSKTKTSEFRYNNTAELAKNLEKKNDGQLTEESELIQTAINAITMQKADVAALRDDLKNAYINVFEIYIKSLLPPED